MRKSFWVLILSIMVILSFTGCKGKKESIPVPAKPQESSAEPEKPEVTENKEEAATEAKPSEESTAAAEPETESHESTADTGLSLAKRLCGKYSYHTWIEDSEQEEFLILNVVEFGDNLYAYCGQAMADDHESLEAYSFWASEFIPFDAGEMKSGEKDSVKVNMLNFSIMSNAGKYWNEGISGTITYTPEGLVFEGFNDDFLCPQGDSRLFLKDERVEDVFPYLKDTGGAADGLSGLWRTKEESPLFLQFKDGNISLYQKLPDSEVYFASGSYDTSKGTVTTMMNSLGSGSMPLEWKAKYSLNGDTLTISSEEDINLSSLSEKTVFERAEEGDIPVMTADRIKFNEDSFGPFGDTAVGSVSDDEGFYGIWTTAAKDYDTAVKDGRKLYELGYESYVCYSPEWEGLSKDAYFCVTAGRFTDKKEAEARLENVKKAGFKDAYIKHSGSRKYNTLDYYNYGDVETEEKDDRVILKDVIVNIKNNWYPSFDEAEPEYKMTLVIDKNTVFDDSCEMEFFGNYEKGDSPLKWYKRNLELMEKDPDKYMSNGPALSGIFEVGITGDHIDRFFGSYWWD
ncbi:MAG: hypothetical protein IJP84_06090 [Lachnospiraceae bacterium]|nr:hypothetical protein [Lachnospiraceae bacterium]